MLTILPQSILSVRHINYKYRIVIYDNENVYGINPKYIYKNGEKHAFKSKREAIGIIKKLYKVVSFSKYHETYGEDCTDYIVLGNKKCILSETCTEDSKIISKLSIS